MKKYIIAAALLAATVSPAAASGDLLSDLLGRVASSLDTKQIVSDAIDGVFTKENLQVEDIQGEWLSTGSAVDFRSESLLKKAGGAVTASTLESKIDPYFKKYGLDQALISIDKEGEITIKTKKFTLRGTISVNDDRRYAGNFIVRFKALGVMSLGEYDTYIALVSNPLSGKKEMKIMFDAQKMVAMMKCVAALSKSSLAKSAVQAIESYDGVCVGFACVPAEASGSSSLTGKGKTNK